MIVDLQSEGSWQSAVLSSILSAPHCSFQKRLILWHFWNLFLGFSCNMQLKVFFLLFHNDNQRLFNLCSLDNYSKWNFKNQVKRFKKRTYSTFNMVISEARSPVLKELGTTLNISNWDKNSHLQNLKPNSQVLKNHDSNFFQTRSHDTTIKSTRNFSVYNHGYPKCNSYQFMIRFQVM